MGVIYEWLLIIVKCILIQKNIFKDLVLLNYVLEPL